MHERTRARRVELEAEQKRLALAFTKGVISEETLDEQVARIRAELVTLPLPQMRDTASAMQAALEAGETLADMASYWGEATAEERRDMVWALLALEGLVYDLERQGIVGLVPRPDTLPVLALGLGEQWEQRPDGGLWLRDGATGGHLRPSGLEDKPPFRSSNLRAQLREEALAQLRAGQSPQQVADTFGVSYWVILRLLKRHDPAKLPAQQQPKLTPEQQTEARRMLAEGMTLRQVGRQFGVSYGAIWRLTQRDQEANEANDTRNERR